MRWLVKRMRAVTPATGAAVERVVHRRGERLGRGLGAGPAERARGERGAGAEDDQDGGDEDEEARVEAAEHGGSSGGVGRSWTVRPGL